MQIRVIWSKRLTAIQEEVNQALEGISNSEILGQEIHFPSVSPADPIVVIIWLKSPGKPKEAP